MSEIIVIACIVCVCWELTLWGIQGHQKLSSYIKIIESMERRITILELKLYYVGVPDGIPSLILKDIGIATREGKRG